jgi:hypothetical protein
MLLLSEGFKDDEQLYHTLRDMMNGTATRPYVYRSSLPRVEKWIAEHLGHHLRGTLLREISVNDSLRNVYFHKIPSEWWTPVVSLTYHMVYLTIMLATILTLWVIYRLARGRGLTFSQALGFVVGFTVVYQLTFQQGAYFYDCIELLGVFTACWLLLEHRMVACTIVIALFSFNKETFFLVPVALFFLHDRNTKWRERIGWLVAQMLCSLAGRYYIMHGTDHLPGGLVENHLSDNLLFWMNPLSYGLFRSDVAKLVPLPNVQNLLVLIPLAVFFRHAWRRSEVRYRRYFVASFVPLLVLFIPFGYKNEIRAFALAYPAFVLIALQGSRDFGEVFSEDKLDESDFNGAESESQAA